MGPRLSAAGRAAAAVVVGAALVGCAPDPPVPAVSSSPTSPSAAVPSPTEPAPTGPTATPPAGELRLSVLGDVGDGGSASAVLESIAARQDDLTLAVGDLSYGDTGAEAQWCRFVTDRLGAEYPFQIVAGNHDDDGPNGVIDAFTACLPNRLPGLVGDYGRQWYVDLPAGRPLVRVVLVSPGLDFGQGHLSYAEGTEHYRWTEDAIRSARATGVPWLVVGMHKPCLSVGKYDCDPGPDLTNLLVREGVDLVLTGHEHMYQRSAALALGAGCPRIEPGRYEPGCLAPSGGTTFITVGTGGKSLRDSSPGDPERPYFRAVSAANENPAHGSLAVTVRPDTLTATFEAVEGAAFSDTVELRRP
ncbi:metallophosphoesterase [uncultured Phycicoccus sp.]|uniref:metallophosphoesterase n=1 Tax=uncultured Phycicoccus sp. TaxID=661422 RepID=UPI00262807A7|nr:metallophosphoesterase [uncultured Phycicoccus sp.]